jgi:hypothetical protein
MALKDWQPLFGVLLGSALSLYPAFLLSRRDHRRRVRMDGYVAIQRYLINSHDLLIHEVNSLATPKPDVDVIGPEAQAIANLVASKEDLEVLARYTRAARDVGEAHLRVKELQMSARETWGASDAAGRTQRAIQERRNRLDRATKALHAVNHAMREDLDIPEVDWDALDAIHRQPSEPLGQ